MSPKPARIDSMVDVDATWIQSVLENDGVNATVESVERSPVGAGKISDLALVKLQYSAGGDDAPAAVICKLHSADPAAHGFAVGAQLYRGEANAYAAIAERSACRIPHLYWSGGSDEHINLVLEDLTATTEPGDQIRGCGMDDARATIGELANLHATFAGLDDATAPGWMTRQPDVAGGWVPIVTMGAGRALELFADDLSADELKVIERAPAAVERFFAVSSSYSHLTLSHGDPRVDNVLFDRRGSEPQSIIIDWQNAGLRNPMFDVAYFLSGSVSPEDRRAHERDAIAEYIDRYSSIASGYDVDTAIEHYRGQLLSGLMQTLAGVGFICADPTAEVPDEARTFLLALLGRNLPAVMDWDSLQVFA